MGSSSPQNSRPSTGRFLRNVLLKALILFLLLNLGFAWTDPLQELGRFSLYNGLFPGRARLPFGEDFERSYNLSILQMEAMFASHEIAAGRKPSDEFRVLLLGDSSVWGFLLAPDQTISAMLNKQNLRISGNEHLRFFNIGYPTMSTAKDLMILDFAMRYEPDLIIWFITLESLPTSKQLTSPLVQHHPTAMRALIDRFNLEIDPDDARFIEPSIIEQTIVGQRRGIADLIRLQLLGVMWAATGIDHDVPASYETLEVELTEEHAFQGFTPENWSRDVLAWDVLAAGVRMAGNTPVVLVNEPIFIAQGQHCDLRYNSYYPRWAYDQYRQWMLEESISKGWRYHDIWDLVPPEAFTDSAIHYSPLGVEWVARSIIEFMNDALNEEFSKGDETTAGTQRE